MCYLTKPLQPSYSISSIHHQKHFPMKFRWSESLGLWLLSTLLAVFVCSCSLGARFYAHWKANHEESK